MGRQTASAWAERPLQLDPAALPVRYQVADGPARTHQVFLDRQRVVLRRTVAERMAMTISLPISAYEGVAVRLFAAESEGVVAAVVLLHREAALSVPLHVAADMDEAAAAWEAWSAALGLPLLAIGEDGAARRVPRRASANARPAPRRRHSHFASRRPRFLTRRKMGRAGDLEVVRNAREIIAPE